MSERKVPDSLIADLDRSGRRLGFMSTMRNHATAAALGLHPTDWQAVDLLSWAGVIPIGELGRQLGLSSAAATSLVDRLSQRGLVERVADPGDRRRILVRPLGMPPGAVEEVEGELVGAMAEHAGRFSPEELEVVLRFMESAADVLERAATDMRHRAGPSVHGRH